MIFKKLNKKERKVFRKWVQDNWKPGDNINFECWHPYVVNEIAKVMADYMANRGRVNE